jgi:putative tricarboxylic transport membrane protein
MTARGRIGGCAVSALGIAYLAAGSAIPEASVGDPLGPRAFPMVLGGLMLCLGLSLAIVPDRAEGAWAGGATRLPMVAALAGLLAVYGYLMPHIGYLIGTCIFLAITTRLLGERSWSLGLSLAAGLSLGIYLLFTRVLGVPLPLGVLDLLRG